MMLLLSLGSIGYRREKFMPDLFDCDRYPDTPGYKEKGGTSEASAEAMLGRANTLRRRALECFIKVSPRGLTADQVADACGVTVLAMRPRITELFLAGWIEKTDMTRQNISGHQARVWRTRTTGDNHEP